MSLPEPRGAQHDALYWQPRGHLVVLGTAGSGKTTLAVLRARHLAQVSPARGPTLLLTFNQMLKTYLCALAPQELAGIHVHTYHEFARGYLARRGKLPGRCIVPDDTVRVGLVTTALAQVPRAVRASAVLQHPVEALNEELGWIERMGLSEVGYAEVSRQKGSGLQVPRAQRAAVWALYQAYRAARAAAGYLYDWDDIAHTVAVEFAADTAPRLYRHVVIDEGQDLAPSMLRSLVAAVPADGSLTFFGDVAQQLYGRRISWRAAGLKVGPHNPVIPFRHNYRNTQEIAAFALALARGPYFQGDPDLVQPEAPAADGVKPAAVACGSDASEEVFIVRQAAERGAVQSVAVLLRTHTEEGRWRRALNAAGVTVRALHRSTPSWTADPGVWLGTYHAAKGLEFDAVFLPQVDASRIPNGQRLAAAGDSAAGLASEARLCYVAATRARKLLVLSYVGELSPIFDRVDPVTVQRTARP